MNIHAIIIQLLRTLNIPNCNTHSQEKEAEMDALKQQLAAENASLLEALGLRERDLENLKLQLEQTGLDRDGQLERKTEELARLEAELAERDRRLAELGVTKDAELHNMRLQLSEKSARLEELQALSEEEERQLAELRQVLQVKEQQINGLVQQLDEKSKEYELMQHALQRHVAAKADVSTEAQLQQVMMVKLASTVVFDVVSLLVGGLGNMCHLFYLI